MSKDQIIGKPIFPDVLRSHMKGRGWTQETVAQAADVSQASVNGWLGGSIPRADALYRLAQKLGVTMEELLTGDSPSEMLAEAQAPYGRKTADKARKIAEKARAALEELEEELKKI